MRRDLQEPYRNRKVPLALAKPSSSRYASGHVPPVSGLNSKLRSWFAAKGLASTVVLNVIVAVVAWTLAELALWPTIGGRLVSPIWPPAGLGVAVIYMGGYRLLPGIVLGSFALGIGHNAWPLAVLVALAQVVQPVVDVRILRALNFDPKLERVRDPIVLSVIAGAAGSFLAAFIAVSLYFLFGARSADAVFYDFTLWWLRDWLGVMVTAPLLFAWGCGRPIMWTWRRAGEAVLLFLTMFASSQLMFGLWGFFASRDVPIAFVFFPLVGWAGLRFGARGATITVAVISGFGMAVSGMGAGPFAAFPVEFTQFLLFLFLALGSLSGLLLAAIIAERDDHAVDAGRTTASLAENGSGRPARRRHRARLQQPAHRDHRLHRDRVVFARSEG
jgi:integral membrane sensor domain MASE1